MNIIQGTLVDLHARKLFSGRVLVGEGRIIAIEEGGPGGGPYILPGFVDSHVHIESSMLVPGQFARLAVRHGTVGVVADPHEVANVSGMSGIEFMIEDAEDSEMMFFFGAPSCVPASPLEKSGFILGSHEVQALISRDNIHFLAEMMNFPGVVHGDTDVIRKLEAAKSKGKPIDGHAPGLTGADLVKYVSAGITTDHECSTIAEAEEKIKLGMKILIREGSAAKNLVALQPLIDLYPDSVMLCTDDCHPDYLVKGHINQAVARAVKSGTNLFNALRAATINPIKHYNLPCGQLRVGDRADLVLVDNLNDFNVLKTYIGGELVWNSAQPVPDINQFIQPPAYPFRNTFFDRQLKLIAESEKMNVIQAIDGELLTKRFVVEGLQIGKEINPDTKKDLLKIVLLDRYSEAPPVVAFVNGFGIKEGAMAASIAHDSHHIIAVGANDPAIVSSLKWIVQSRGGICYAEGNGNITGIRLPFFGLMSNEPGEEVSRIYTRLNGLVRNAGCTLHSPFMTMSFMALTVIPEIKIYHKGLFDGIAFKPMSIFI